jgi:hypothetical protein
VEEEIGDREVEIHEPSAKARGRLDNKDHMEFTENTE